ncbi:MAG: hypothetical protein H7831_10975 [Magnetococcus sp. WYHC-3]
MSALRQLQVRPDLEEDRLLLRIRTGDEQEFQFWLTRHFMKKLWPAMLQSLGAEVVPPTVAEPARRQALLAFQHEQTLERANFATPYDENPPQSFPLGAQPLLVVQAGLRAPQGGTWVLTLRPSSGQGVDLGLDPTLMHGLCKLLSEAAARMDWDLDFQVVTTAPGTPPSTRLN